MSRSRTAVSPRGATSQAGRRRLTAATDAVPALTAPVAASFPIATQRSLRQPARRINRMVGDDDVGASSLDACQCFEYGTTLVQPAIRRGGFQHRVLATDIVGDDGQIPAVA